MSQTAAPSERKKAWLALLLACIAGSVDAIGYLTLLHLFTAHMSGNSAAFSAHLGQGDWSRAIFRLLPIPVFVVGVFAGAALGEIAMRRGVRSPMAAAFAVEAALLFAFMICGSSGFQQRTVEEQGTAPLTWKLSLLIALPAFAMGIQNATLRRVGGKTVRTTYVSGMLTNFAEESLAYIFWLHDRTTGRSWSRMQKTMRVSLRQSSFKYAAFFGGIWCAFVLGAVSGGWLSLQWQIHALLFPLSGLALLILLDLRQPIQPSRP